MTYDIVTYSTTVYVTYSLQRTQRAIIMTHHNAKHTFLSYVSLLVVSHTLITIIIQSI